MKKIDLLKYWITGKLPHEGVPAYNLDEIQEKVDERSKTHGWGATPLVPATCRMSTRLVEKWCAIIGPNTEEGWVAYGDTESEAIQNVYKAILGG